MLGRKSITDEDLLCPQCSDIYCIPVILVCGHNICKVCLYNFWEVRKCRNCPVCGIESPGVPPINLSLQNSVDNFKVQIIPEESDECSLHNEKLKVFCNNDEEPICLVCQISRQHTVHKCCPVEEAAIAKKAEISDILESLRKKVKIMKKTKQQWEETKTYIKTQSSQVETEIKQEFQKLHQFLRDEESTILKVLKQEEETKTQVLYKKIENIEKQIKFLSFTIIDIDKTLTAKDLPFLKNYKKTKSRVKCNIPDPESIRDILINSSNHLGRLPYGVWKKMVAYYKVFFLPEVTQKTTALMKAEEYAETCQPQKAPVILDPNTAHSNLKLSQGLTSVQYSNKQPLPDNIERCTSRMCVLGAIGFTSGKHRWTVEVGQGKDWYIGVAQESIKRKNTVFLTPVEGFWVIGYCSKDSIWAHTSPRTRIAVKQKPERITIELDYNKGKVIFINDADSSMIHTFKDKFSERIFPYFALGLCEDWKNSCPLTITATEINIGVE